MPVPEAPRAVPAPAPAPVGEAGEAGEAGAVVGVEDGATATTATVAQENDDERAPLAVTVVPAPLAGEVEVEAGADEGEGVESQIDEATHSDVRGDDDVDVDEDEAAEQREQGRHRLV